MNLPPLCRGHQVHHCGEEGAWWNTIEAGRHKLDAAHEYAFARGLLRQLYCQVP